METVSQQASKKAGEFTFLAIVFVMWCIVLLCTIMVLSSAYNYSSQNTIVVNELQEVLKSIHTNYGWILNPQNLTGVKE
jgi:hypothetical protein